MPSKKINLTTSPRGGFTILELIIVVAVIALISFVSAPLGLQFYNSQMIDGVQSQLGDSLTRARSRSIVQEGDSQYGVCLVNVPATTTSYILYQGTSCPGTLGGFDEVYPLINGVAVTFPASVTDINFAKHTGTPSATGTISINWNSLTRTITVDDFGTITEQ
jgi:prepilin-type N-terminal cleavage/methylation domain-containing protein